jgi:hypothetical protein
MTENATPSLRGTKQSRIVYTLLISYYLKKNNNEEINFTFINNDASRGRFCTNRTLYVPSGTESRYKAADGWKSFGKIVSRKP